MDIIISIGIQLMLGLAIFHISVWHREKWTFTSSHLRSALLMLVCFTLLTFLLFGIRIFLKPEVAIVYNDVTLEIYSNQVVTDSNHIIDQKKLMVCNVVFEKSYPMFVYIGKDTKNTRYKVPCDSLTPEMKSDVSSLVSYLKEEVHVPAKQ